jgi:hypothetical protein
MDWKSTFNSALRYREFLDTCANESHRQRWQALYDRVQLTNAQIQLLAGFTRQMNVLCLTGAWCGDCVNQCPILLRFADASPQIDLRFVDRDENTTLRDYLSICFGNRVPMVVFLSEEFAECGRYGDRTLSKYREMAQTLLGAACPTGSGGANPDLLAAVTAEWLSEFERIQLMLRLSPRLRRIHGD